MAKRKEANQREYNPLDDARGRFPIDVDLVRDVINPPAAITASAPAPVASVSAPMPEPVVEPPPIVRTFAPEPAPEPVYASYGSASSTPVPVDEYAGRRKPLTIEKLTKYNKFLTTPREKLELERLSARISGALGVSVKPSQIIRACLIYLLYSEPHLIQRAERQGPVKRPSNTEAVALAEFDHILAEILSQGFRQAGPIKARQ